MNRLNKLNDSEILEILENSTSISDFLRKIGYKTNTGGGYKILHKECIKRNLDISFYKKKFRLNTNNKISNKLKKIPIEEILIENSKYENRTRLKERLIKEKILEYKCIECENNGEWRGKKLSLQLNHKNGINNDNRIENIEFICPNCHSQTENYAGKNKIKN